MKGIILGSGGFRVHVCLDIRGDPESLKLNPIFVSVAGSWGLLKAYYDLLQINCRAFSGTNGPNGTPS